MGHLSSRWTAVFAIVLLGAAMPRAGLVGQQPVSPARFAGFERAAITIHRADSAVRAKAYDLAAATYRQAADDWIHPGDAYYNAACAAALGGHPDQAIAELNLAIKAGYRAAQQLANDADLASLHARREWTGLVARVTAAMAAFRKAHGDPDRARVVTSDIPRFWHAYDLADRTQQPTERAAIYRRDYFEGGSIGLADYFLGKIRSIDRFSAFIDGAPRYYGSIRQSTTQVAADVSSIRAVLRRMKELYADATFPDIYFVIGRLSSGGTSTPTGLVLGAEMFSATAESPRDEIGQATRDFLNNAAIIPTIVAHELVHFEQRQTGDATLLHDVLIEGGANFIAKLITGQETDTASMRFGRAHEGGVWQRFQKDMHGTDDGDWIANGGSNRVGADWMHDMGYFVGFQIAQAYYAQAHDKTQAIRALLELREPDAILKASGYGPGPGR